MTMFWKILDYLGFTVAALLTMLAFLALMGIPGGILAIVIILLYVRAKPKETK